MPVYQFEVERELVGRAVGVQIPSSADALLAMVDDIIDEAARQG